MLAINILKSSLVKTQALIRNFSQHGGMLKSPHQEITLKVMVDLQVKAFSLPNNARNI